MNNLNQVEVKRVVNGVEVANLSQLAVMFGKQPAKMLSWIEDTTFPKPLAEVRGAGRNGRSRLFSVDEVREWVNTNTDKTTGRKTNEWSSLFSKLALIAKSSPATYKIILEMIDEASRK